ncbi:MAG: hypothetical protein U9Q99_03315 [Nanoarchaeota archaeon]|nr:hypothetical protein [Nanoarchaeota archaeon]
MKSHHVVNEDYASYKKRRDKKLKIDGKILITFCIFILIFGLIYNFKDSQEKKEIVQLESETLRCGMNYQEIVNLMEELPISDVPSTIHVPRQLIYDTEELGRMTIYLSEDSRFKEEFLSSVRDASGKVIMQCGISEGKIYRTK